MSGKVGRILTIAKVSPNREFNFEEKSQVSSPESYTGCSASREKSAPYAMMKWLEESCYEEYFHNLRVTLREMSEGDSTKLRQK